jgi:hypothetical protein
LSSGIRVHIPEGFRLPFKCVIKIGATAGLPGDLLLAPAGDHEVVIELTAEVPLFIATGAITFHVRVAEGRTTEIYLGILDGLLRTSGTAASTSLAT